jgi:hypothetical protein
VQVSPAQQASPKAPQVTGASTGPPSTVLVRVVVAVEVGVVVPVTVEVPVVVVVVVFVEVAVVVGVEVVRASVRPASVAVVGVSGRPASAAVVGVSGRPASGAAASLFLFPPPSPAQAASTRAIAQEATFALWIKKLPGNATSVRGLLIGVLRFG